MQYGMHFGSRARGAALAMASMSAAALLVTACQPGSDTAGSTAAPSGGTATKPTASSAASSKPATPSGGTGTSAAPTGAPTSKAPASGSGGVTATPVATTKTCAAESLKAFMYQAAVRPPGTGTGAAIVEFTNMSGAACVLQGYPTVAGAANGTPEKNRPLTVTKAGPTSKVVLAPAAKAWVKLTFVQVQGEADGYCVSGSTPVSYPTLVVGLPGSGANQLALEDGVLAECDNKVTVTAVTATKPS
ncbi:DUF4232 domain-containing protein [Streptomyces sp. NPDC021080]|uniref:DUF4232 domain-containing protein n=1 Tax=Streptomyces sp. NPDC021080 TaxID=3365110 RepID=UPI0037BDCB4E